MASDRETREPMDTQAPTAAQAGDLTALAWVHEEVRRSLDNAHKSLRRLARDLEHRGPQTVIPGAGVVPAVQQARALLHQTQGVLSMVGLPEVAQCLGATTLVLQRLGGSPHAFTGEVVADLERLSYAVQDYLARRLAGQEVSSLALFPAYRTVMRLGGAERIHPADLCQAPAIDLAALPVPRIAPHLADARLRNALESALLGGLRGSPESLAKSCRLYASLAAGEHGEAAALWTLAAAFHEAQAVGLLSPDEHVRRLGPRLLAQVRAAERGSHEVPQRLLHDLWFFCSRAQPPRRPTQAPLLLKLRQAGVLGDLWAATYEDSRLGRFDPALVPLARRRVGSFKDIWAVAATGDVGVLPACAEQASLVADSLSQLYPGGERLAAALVETVKGCAAASRVPGPELAMEVATTLLCLDASLDDLDQPELAGRIDSLARRLDGVRQGSAPEPIEPWMEGLYREVSDRQTMGSVVQELRAALAEAEQQLDRFHRHPEERQLLIPVPGELATMRGVLSVLGLDAAAQAVQRMRGDVEQMISGDGDVEASTARLADNLGVMSFLIDMLGVQPALAKSLFRFDPDTGAFTAVMGRAVQGGAGQRDASRLRERAQALAGSVASEALSHEELRLELDTLAHQAEAADQPDLVEATARAREALAQARNPADRDAALADAAQAITAIAQPPVAPATPDPAPQPAGTDDEDMREVFFEEAAEVIAGAREALAQLDHDAHDLGAMTTVRRAFHTLKGSARMVQLADVGEAAWACEQLYNSRLAQADAAVDRELRHFTADALNAFEAWVQALAAGQPAGVDGRALAARALALKDGATPPPAAAAPVAPADRPAVAEDAAADADIDADTDAPAAAQATAPMPLLPELPPVDLLDLEEPDFVPEGDEVLPVAEVREASGWPALDAPISEAVPEPAARPAAEPLSFSFDLDLDLPGAGEATALTEALAAAEPLAAVAETPTADAEVPPEDWSPTSFEASPDLSAGVDFELDLDLDADTPDTLETVEPAPVPPEPEPEPALVAPVPEPEPEPAPVLRDNVVPLPTRRADDEAERTKLIGDLKVPIALFNIYLNEADEQSRRLCTELSEWQLELDQPVSETAVALAHSMAGNSATVGFSVLSQLSRRLEHALERAHGRGHGEAGEAALFVDVAEEIRRLLHQFAAGFLREVSPEIDARLSSQEAHDAALVSLQGALLDGSLEPEWQPEPEPEPRPVPVTPPVAPVASVSAAEVAVSTDDIDAVDAVDPELFEIFTEEAEELVPELAEQVRRWEQDPADIGLGVAAMRSLHTLKGGARLAGAMRLGEMAHRLETSVESLTVRGVSDVAAIGALHHGVDALAEELHRLMNPAAADTAEPALDVPVAQTAPVQAEAVDAPVALPETEPPQALAEATGAADMAEVAEVAEAAPAAPRWGDDQPAIDWSRYAREDSVAPGVAPAVPAQDSVAAGVVRVRAQLLDRLVGHAGEVGTARGRIDTEVGQMRNQMRELSDNLERLRRQLRDLELQAETQMSSRLEAARQSQQSFDPLEMDRFTRVQELTRMMAESVGDVGTVQRAMQQALQASEDQLAAQARLTRELQDDLLRARMVEFDTVSDRLYRVVRQAAKESGKQVRLNLSGGSVELDRSVLDRMAPAFEHLLRNAVVHGIEAPELRENTGKPATGTIDITLRQAGNEVRIEVRDDGAGLNLARIADKARDVGLLGEQDRPTEAELANLIFRPGFTTADEVTELAGRGIGMDVVRAEVTAMGGRIETTTATGQGTAFQLVLPLTTAVTQVVLLDCDGLTVAVPSTLVAQVRRVPAAEIEAAYASGVLRHGDADLPFHWLGALLQHGVRGTVEGRTGQVVVVRSASQHVAVHVHDVVGNQEVVVKNLGPQLARLPGLAGMSLLLTGEPVLIYNPVALAAVYGEEAARRLAAQPPPQAEPEAGAPVAESAPQAPLVLVVDDSLTVRRVTQRLLQREGYRVALARDGLEALAQLAEERPALMLSDIEMPRMDGFDLVRNVKAEPRWKQLPIVMITSRIAQKHRDHALELGVEHYLGKPYDEEALLSLVRQYAGRPGALVASA